MRQTNAELHYRLRHVAQILIAEVGADGPMDAEAAAERAVATILALRDEVDRLRAKLHAVAGWMSLDGMERAEAEIGRLRALLTAAGGDPGEPLWGPR